MDESRELNAVIDVIMLAGTILLKSGSTKYHGSLSEGRLIFRQPLKG